LNGKGRSAFTDWRYLKLAMPLRRSLFRRSTAIDLASREHSTVKAIDLASREHSTVKIFFVR